MVHTKKNNQKYVGVLADYVLERRCDQGERAGEVIPSIWGQKKLSKRKN